VRVDFATGKLSIEGTITEGNLRQRVEALGYALQDNHTVRTESQAEQAGGVWGFLRYLTLQQETRLALMGGAGIIITLLLSFTALTETVVGVLYTLAMAVAAYPIAKSGLRTLWINHDFNINLLMTIAAVGAVVIGEYLEAATVIFLFAIGEALEGYTADRARDSLRGLMALAPTQAIRLSGNTEENVPVEDLRIDDIILVKPGERISMDGIIIRGESGVNQASITGESIPAHKTANDTVFAGTINGEGALHICVSHLAADNTLSRIIKLVEEAQSVRAPSQRIVDSFARIYTPAVVVVAAFVAIIPPLFFNAPFYDTADMHGWFYRALSLLVISCPCALVISTPVTIISAITAAARRGVLIKGGAHLETLGRIKALAFDKTGTITQGEPVVTHFRSAECVTEDECEHCDDVLALAAAVERRSTHPLAQAVVNAAKQYKVDHVYAPAEAVAALAGQGIQGDVNGKQVTVGSHQLFDEDYPHEKQLCGWVDNIENKGRTAMLIHDGDRVRGFIAVADEPRPDSREVIQALKAMDMTTVMLTGDNAAVAQAVGTTVGIDDIRAGLLPEDKVDALRGLLADYKQVAMIGDGINDTPALAAASVGIAMGGAGSAQAMETADIVLMADDIKQLPYAIRLARFARHLIRQNILFSFVMKFGFVILALMGLTTMWMAVLADVGMTFMVTLNGMRPKRLQ
jgi:Zn2+/Cd2+-exporting ATPase